MTGLDFDRCIVLHRYDGMTHTWEDAAPHAAVSDPEDPLWPRLGVLRPLTADGGRPPKMGKLLAYWRGGLLASDLGLSAFEHGASFRCWENFAWSLGFDDPEGLCREYAYSRYEAAAFVRQFCRAGLLLDTVSEVLRSA